MKLGSIRSEARRQRSETLGRSSEADFAEAGAATPLRVESPRVKPRSGWRRVMVAVRKLLTRRVRSARLAAVRIERQRSEAAARARAEERRRLEAVLDLAATMVRTTDGTIQLWAAGCTTLFGYSRDEAVGRKVQELLQTEFPIPRQEIEAALGACPRIR